MNLKVGASINSYFFIKLGDKGYPNIESLKCISKFFSVSIDELLSGEELLTLAETENNMSLRNVEHALQIVGLEKENEKTFG